MQEVDIIASDAFLIDIHPASAMTPASDILE